MMRRILGLSLLLLSSWSLDARVISYAPYSDKLAIRGHHSRTTRHFALIETPVTSTTPDYTTAGQVVLYDSAGLEEPRVIYPKNGAAALSGVALFQERPDQTPLILVIAYPNPRFSRDGGRSWKIVEGLSGNVIHSPTDVDYGGPWTRGLSAAIRIGTRAYPFVVSTSSGVFKISANGTAKLMMSGPLPENALIGQNREGTEFLMKTARRTIVAAGLDGNWRHIGPTGWDPDGGWIAPDGSAYVIEHDQGARNRTLTHYRDGRREVVASPYSDVGSLAVPTHDFSGAWYVEWIEDEGTTLYRHTPGRKLETMWVDPRTPQVEALHAGASGRKVLVQVHRPRQAQNKTFIDPALAVWNVGGPAPAEYDELFLNEGPFKGFVHVDADTIESGAPFVFDSSYKLAEPPDIIVSAPISNTGDVVQEWGVVRASLKQRLVMQGVSRTASITDLVIQNPLDERQSVAIEYIPSGMQIAGSANEKTTITLEANEIRVITDVLGTLFDVSEGTGSLLFTPKKGVNLNGRTYTRHGSGTHGYTMPAIDFFNVASPRFAVSFGGAFPSANSETRVLVTDTSGRGTTVELQACNAKGKAAASALTASSPASGILDVDLTPPDRGGLIVQPKSGSGIAGVIATDKLSGDATYFPPDLPAADVRSIPFIAHTDAANGKPALRTDLYLINLSPGDRSITLEVKPYDTNQWPRSQTYWLKPYESRIIEDPLQKLFSLKGIARLRYHSWGYAGDATGVRVTSRTYTVAQNGGTYGTLVPPLNSFQSVTGGESLELLTLAGGMRLSLGLVELSPNPRNNSAAVRITIIDDHGVTVDTHTVTVSASAGLLIDDLFAARKLTPPPAARIIVQALNDWSLLGAYALLTDPVTNDTAYVGANLGETVK